MIYTHKHVHIMKAVKKLLLTYMQEPSNKLRNLQTTTHKHTRRCTQRTSTRHANTNTNAHTNKHTNKTHNKIHTNVNTHKQRCTHTKCRVFSTVTPSSLIKN